MSLVEVITSVQRRRRWTAEQKKAMVEEAEQPKYPPCFSLLNSIPEFIDSTIFVVYICLLISSGYFKNAK